VRSAWVVALAWVGASPGLAAGQVGGNLAAPPPVDLYLDITTGPEGLILTPSEFELITGEYYRLNVTADGRRDWRLEVDQLLQNSHLRLLTIEGIEVHLQAIVFRAIEFDVEGTASFSFTPIRPGDYTFFVGDVPSAELRPIGTAGPRGRVSYGLFVVR
jgi:hypothetical protein